MDSRAGNKSQSDHEAGVSADVRHQGLELGVVDKSLKNKDACIDGRINSS